MTPYRWDTFLCTIPSITKNTLMYTDNKHGKLKRKDTILYKEGKKTYLRKADLFVLLVWRWLVVAPFQFSFQLHNPFLQGLFVSFGLQNTFLILVPDPSIPLNNLNLQVLQLWIFLRGFLK